MRQATPGDTLAPQIWLKSGLRQETRSPAWSCAREEINPCGGTSKLVLTHLQCLYEVEFVIVGLRPWWGRSASIHRHGVWP